MSGRRVRWGMVYSIFAAPVLLLTTLAVLVGSIYGVRESFGKKAFLTHLDQLVARGEPIDNLSVLEHYLSKTSADESQRWEEALLQVEDPEWMVDKNGVYGMDPKLAEMPIVIDGPWDCEKATRQFATKYQALAVEVRQLSALKQAVYFPIEFNAHLSLLPHLDRLRSVARLLQADCLIALRDGDSERACQNIQALIDLRHVVTSEPFLVSQLVGIALQSMGTDLFRHALQSGRLQPTEIAAIRDQLQIELDLPSTWRQMISGERSMALPVFINPGLQNDTVMPTRGHDGIAFLKIMEQAENLDCSSIDSLLVESKRFSHEIDERFRKGSWLQTIDQILTGLFTPALAAASDALIRSIVDRRLATTAASIVLYKHQHQQWPTSLEQLNLPAQSIMPTGGRPFGYSVNQDGTATVWGFDTRQATSTPETPPAGNEPADIEKNERVIWRLK